ncbi:MAG: DNA polymerase I, partial [Deltaproteobacteria bacterium]|nr:DNA polymerase I [Deltaproteobacteria bacterium]
GRRIREAFVAPAGRLLVSADYSQIELRILAHVSGDPLFVEAFSQGQDIHARTASEVFGVPLGQITPRQRRDAKAINFGLLYGMGPFRLAQQLGIEHAAAKAYLNAYFERYSGIRRWHDQTLQQARSDGQVATLFGRRRILHELSSRNHSERQAAERIAINTPIQGTAADIIKRAMLAVDRTLTGAAPSARLLLQVHDELVVEVAADEVEAARAALVQAMAGAAELRVPLVVDVGIGRSWAEAH